MLLAFVPHQLIVASLLHCYQLPPLLYVAIRSNACSTPPLSLIAVAPPAVAVHGHRDCVVHGWHFESRLSRFSTHPNLPLVDCSLSSLCTLPGVDLPTNCDVVVNAVLLTQLPLAIKTNAICVRLTSVPPPPISSIPTLSVSTATNLFHLEVHLLPFILLLGHCCC